MEGRPPVRQQRKDVVVGQLAEVGVPLSHATEPARGDESYHLAGFLFHGTQRRGGRDRHGKYGPRCAARPHRAQGGTRRHPGR
jgi:hypothetical protein